MSRLECRAHAGALSKLSSSRYMRSVGSSKRNDSSGDDSALQMTEIPLEGAGSSARSQHRTDSIARNSSEPKKGMVLNFQPLAISFRDMWTTSSTCLRYVTKTLFCLTSSLDCWYMYPPRHPPPQTRPWQFFPAVLVGWGGVEVCPSLLKLETYFADTCIQNPGNQRCNDVKSKCSS